MKKRALISVFDKTNLIEFAKEIINTGFEIISTGGTYKYLKENNIDVLEVSSLTDFPEILNGRVKTLHPKVHGGILARLNNKEDLKELEENKISPISLVVVNLYPFKEMQEKNLSIEELVEFIDIGGVTLLRAAAKNFEWTTSVPSPEFYEEITKELKENNGEISYETRKALAIKTFALTSKYDAEISNGLQVESLTPEIFNLNIEKNKELRYGENPHQKAALYTDKNSIPFEVLNGKELSFNNIVDMNAAYSIISEFIGVSSAVIIKHNNPCGAAIGENIQDAYLKAFDCDPISAFGGIVGLSETVTAPLAKIMKEVFLEVIIAPDFEEEALEILKQKKNLRLVKVETDLLKFKQAQNYDIKPLSFGTLVQTTDRKELDKDTFKVVTEKKPNSNEVEDMIFAWKIVKNIKSNGIVIAKDKKTIGIGTGQTSRIASVEIALNQACDEAKDAVLASDGFFPATDNIIAAAQSRISAIIQPAGSIKDKDVIEECNKLNLSMITTGIRHFKH